MKYFVANWKANHNLKEALVWIDEFIDLIGQDKKVLNNIESQTIQIIIAPPHSLIHPVKERLSKFESIKLAAQDVSSFEAGRYTGEVCAKSLQGLVDYVLVGHSERRINLSESNDQILKKINLAVKYNIRPILCARDSGDLVGTDVEFVMYEPTYAIASGDNVNLNSILKMRPKFNLKPNTKFFYGGSVNEGNIKEYLTSELINGFVIGTASEKALDFYKSIACL